MTEEKTSPALAPASVFAKRMLVSLVASASVILTMLSVGIAGYHWIAELGWVDSLLNASMILGGMGPVNELKSEPAKIFASIYALFSGLVFVGAAGVSLSPLFHRILHAFHIDDRDIDED